ncbi:hypothetical protein GCM10023321_81030 [Pseudonocardia eucalypti]|uniref:Uncharacterized protein n=1 Tax=Pseudonocardia eucalypti TaxID=648755 RepID=A0ABP9RDR4_9PSEU
MPTTLPTNAQMNIVPSPSPAASVNPLVAYNPDNCTPMAAAATGRCHCRCDAESPSRQTAFRCHRVGARAWIGDHTNRANATTPAAAAITPAIRAGTFPPVNATSSRLTIPATNTPEAKPARR